MFDVGGFSDLLLSMGMMLEHVAQTPLVLAGTYDTHYSVIHRRNKNTDARSHDQNSASINNSFWRFLGLYLNCGATCGGTIEQRKNK